MYFTGQSLILPRVALGPGMGGQGFEIPCIMLPFGMRKMVSLAREGKVLYVILVPLMVPL